MGWVVPLSLQVGVQVSGQAVAVTGNAAAVLVACLDWLI